MLTEDTLTTSISFAYLALCYHPLPSQLHCSLGYFQLMGMCLISFFLYKLDGSGLFQSGTWHSFLLIFSVPLWNPLHLSTVWLNLCWYLMQNGHPCKETVHKIYCVLTSDWFILPYLLRLDKTYGSNTFIFLTGTFNSFKLSSIKLAHETKGKESININKFYFLFHRRSPQEFILFLSGNTRFPMSSPSHICNHSLKWPAVQKPALNSDFLIVSLNSFWFKCLI